MLHILDFFKDAQAAWRRTTAGSDSQYQLGGVHALRDAGDRMSARKDVLDLDKLGEQLRETDKENRDVQELNKRLNEELRKLTEKNRQQAHALGQRDELLAQKNKAVAKLVLSKQQSETPAAVKTPPQPPAGLEKKLADALGEIGSLRQRIKILEENLRQQGLSTADPASSNAQALRAQMEVWRARVYQAEQYVEAGSHKVSLPLLLKRMRKVFTYRHRSIPEKLFSFYRILETSELILSGLQPKDLEDGQYDRELVEFLQTQQALFDEQPSPDLHGS